MRTIHRPVRIRLRSGPLLAVLAAMMVFVVGCGAGQITQTSTQVAAVNGNHAQVDGVELLNVYFNAEPTDNGEARFGQVRLAFTAVNTSNTTDRLVSVESPAAASLTIEGPEHALEMRPGTSLSAGQPIEQLTPPTAPDEPLTVRAEFPAENIRPGLTYPVTFTFEKAGAVTLQVPFDVWKPGESVAAPNQLAAAT